MRSRCGVGIPAAYALPCVVAFLVACAPSGAGHVRVTPIAHGPRELTPDQQIYHALNRLAFGPRPADIQRVKKMGLDRWIGEQLAPERINDDALDTILTRFGTLSLDQRTLGSIYAQPALLRKQGGLTPDTMAIKLASTASNRIITDMRSAKLARAVMSNRQLQEVMTDFWENHFSVYGDKGPVRFYLPAYDSTIRAHALGKFRDLLDAVAHAPAMLYYLDNWQSRADSNEVTLSELESEAKSAAALARYAANRKQTHVDQYGRVITTVSNTPPPKPYHRPVRHGRGLNENYGRELMELHTLGVDGGYTQHDVTEASRVLTGWTLEDPEHVGMFVFKPGMHDAAQKVILGHIFPAGHGVDEGERLLDILASHPSTARFIATKLVRRFVSDTPPAALVARAAQTFMSTDGDIAQVLRTIVSSPEFWSRSAYRTKIKSPFEVVASTARALGAQADTSPRMSQLVARLGEPLFGHLDPNGYPETADGWINTGMMLNRINFGVQTAAGQIPVLSLKTWPATPSLAKVPREVQVDSVISIMFNNDVSAQTRQALQEQDVVPANRAVVTGTPHSLTQVMGVALGAPEFEER